MEPTDFDGFIIILTDFVRLAYIFRRQKAMHN